MKKLRLNIIGGNQVQTKDGSATPEEAFKDDRFLHPDLYLVPELPGNQTQNRRARELKFLSVKKESMTLPSIGCLEKLCSHRNL